MPASKTDAIIKAIQAGLLSWLVPGVGHWRLGHRGLAVVFFLAISLPYWTGVAFGGILDSINPRTNKWVFLAACGVSGYTVPGFFVSQTIERSVLREAGLRGFPDPLRAPEDQVRLTGVRKRYMSFFPESDVAQIYIASAGLLNLLVILDAIARAQTGGLPTFHRELERASAEGARV